MQPIAAWNFEIIKPGSQIDVLKLTSSSLGHIQRKPLRFACDVQFLSAPIRERLYHALSVVRHVTHVKKEFLAA